MQGPCQAMRTCNLLKKCNYFKKSPGKKCRFAPGRPAGFTGMVLEKKRVVYGAALWQYYR